MALVHEFKLISSDKDLENIDGGDKGVELSDSIFLYISDTLEWIITEWNNKKTEIGLNYYGFSVISGENIKKFQEIINCWIKLFQSSPKQFNLTYEYDVEKQDFEKIQVSKQDLLKELTAILDICSTAIELNKKILHLGI